MVDLVSVTENVVEIMGSSFCVYDKAREIFKLYLSFGSEVDCRDFFEIVFSNTYMIQENERDLCNYLDSSGIEPRQSFEKIISLFEAQHLGGVTMDYLVSYSCYLLNYDDDKSRQILLSLLFSLHRVKKLCGDRYVFYNM